MSNYDFAERLMDLDWQIWEEMGLESRPSGYVREEYFNNILDKLEEEGIDPEDIDDEVYDILESENAHSLSDALNIFCGKDTIEDAMERERNEDWF